MIIIFIVGTCQLVLSLPKDGMSLQAADLQNFCENLLKKDNIKGCIIVYEVKKDKIAAIVSPNIALKNYYPMGSVFKIVSAFALYKEKIVNYSTKINCENYYKIQNKNYICTKPGGHGEVNLSKAIAYSCSIYFYNFYDKYCRGMPTCPKLVEGWHAPTYYTRLLLDDKNNKCKIKQPKNLSDFADMAVGERDFVQIKPIQMINLLKHLIKEDINIDKKYYFAVKEGMYASCENGTSRNINLNAAGKTGTPEDINHKGKFHGWFIGWSPAKNPKVAVIVFLEDGKGYEAAQIAGKVLRVATETPFGFAQGRQRAQSLKHL